MICSGGCGCGPERGNTFRRTNSAASWGSWERKACTAASPAAPGSSSPKRFPPPWRNQAKSSSVASECGSLPQESPSGECAAGGLAGLHEVVQAEVARDERGGLAVRLVQGSGSLARALIKAVGPKRLHLLMGYCAATSPAARSTPLRSARA